ncbi:MAG: B12-binding domain-containing radical SAM protein [Nitrospirae bacterium]|nr:B12-binding domain-containing radical SAM protein [Nitrospirota bacterium]
MKVLLVYPPRRKDPFFYPPTSLLYIAQAIKDYGHDAKIIDIPYLLEKHPDKFSLMDNSIYDYILKEDFDLLGLGGVVSTYFFYDDFVNRIRQLKKDIPIIAGGTVGFPIKDVWEKYAPVDYLVNGDGEIVIKKLLGCLQHADHDAIKKIPGLCYLNNGKYTCVAPEEITDLDSIPYLNYDSVDYDYYINELSKFIENIIPDRTKVKYKQLRALPLLTSRGCPFECKFCFHFTRKHRYHSIDYVIGNIKYLKNKYGINFFYIVDDLFNLNKKRTIDLCETIHKASLDIQFFAGGGKPSLVTGEVLAAMKKAGFVRFSYGIESGSQKMLDIMNKKTTVQQNLNALKLAEEHGISGFANIVFGMPGEDFNTINETRDFLIRAGVSSNKFSYAWATAYPGAPLFQYMLDNGLVADIRKYLFDVGSPGYYIHNFTDLPFRKLEEKVKKIVLEVDLAYYKGMKDYKKIWPILLKMSAIEMFYSLPEKLQNDIRGKVSGMFSLLRKKKATTKSSSHHIEEYVTKRKAKIF